MQDRQTLSLKGMVCNRCITVLKSSLEQLSLSVEEISLGKVTVSGLNLLASYSDLNATLALLDFEIIEDPEQKLVADIKTYIGEVLNSTRLIEGRVRFSKVLSEKFHTHYDTLSAVFSRVEGVTLESYVIRERVNTIRKYLMNTDHSLTEIAFLTGYSSVFHLSKQFKAIAAVTPSEFRQLHKKANTLWLN
ncbi:MAG TPA: helix-turn-helix transcriptional regulator [Sphingobacteriaceae bacterium]